MGQVIQQTREEEELSDYQIDYLFVDSIKSYYGIIDGLTIEPVWVPKSATGKDLRIKIWWVNQYKSGKSIRRKVETKVVQTKLKIFISRK
ncbi:MAG: hypothetical protein ACTSQF_13285 [Candidatus Heimdallarchaeaceae archaeon]